MRHRVRLMNPMNYVDDERALKARHYRIRHGAVDRDTSLAISEMLALKLAGAGVDTDIEHPWGIPHAGDYDLDGLFAWIDGICKRMRCAYEGLMRLMISDLHLNFLKAGKGS